MNWPRKQTHTIALLLLTALTWSVQGQVYISEFMASNSSTLRDEEDDYTDWIEIYNASEEPIDLKGWSLTDDAGNLNKWQFPSHRLGPHEFLVVHASGKDRNEVGSAFHTNFKLSRSGEYLALVDPYGNAVHEYYPAYPVQHNDVSYGLLFSVPAHAVLDADHTFRYLVPTNDAVDEVWIRPNFDDSEWKIGHGGIGYSVGSSAYDKMIQTKVKDGTISTYIRHHFELEDTDFASLGLGVQYDDGFVAYLNGERVASDNAPEELQWDTLSHGGHNEIRVNDFRLWDITENRHLLREGENVLAVHLINRSPTSSDLLLVTKLEISGGRIQEPVTYHPLTAPTPGRHNATPHQRVVKPVSFSVANGFYDKPFEVQLSTETEGATIHYTLDCSDPQDESGMVYSNAIPIDDTTILRAAASRKDMRNSHVSTHSYLFIDDVINSSPDGVRPGPRWPTNDINEQVMDYGLDPEILKNPRYAHLITNAFLDIPSYSLVVDPSNLFCESSGLYVNAPMFGPGWERPASVELLYPDGTEGFQIECGVRIRGGHSRWPHNPKHSFRLLFRGSYGHGHLAYPLFGDEGATEFENIDLRTSQNYSWAFENGEHYTMCREVFSRDTQRDMGQPYTRSHACHLYVNGHYWGLFQTQERSEASYAETYFGGHASDYDVIKIRGGIGRKFVVMATDGDIGYWERLWKATNKGFETDEKYYRVLGRDPDGSRNPEYAILVDPDNLIDYMLCTYYVGDPDGPVNPTLKLPNNFYAILRRDGTMGFQYFRHDAEHSMDELHEDRTITTELGIDTFRHFNPKVLHEKLSEHPDYRQRVADRIHKFFFNGGALTADACLERFNKRVKEIESAVIAESARWGDAKSERPRTRDDDWRPAINYVLEEYIPQRSDIVLNQLRNSGYYPNVTAVSFSQFGGHVRSGFELIMTAPEGKIYFTTDGQDPRLPGGGKYRGSFVRRAAGGKPLKLTIDRTTHVKARVYHKGEWSALTEATFAIGITKGNLRVTELMYHPPMSEDSPRYDADDFEFIEVYNAGPETIDLAGCAFTEGIDFRFSHVLLEPNRFAVVCRNIEAFSTRYDIRHITIAGEYTGGLSDTSDRIRLEDAFGETITVLQYDDSFPSTDGGGHSISLINPVAGHPTDFIHEWRPSKRPLGTPGFSDGRPMAN